MCPARPSAQELWEWLSRRAYTQARLALTVVGCGGLLEWRDKQSHANTATNDIVATLWQLVAMKGQ